jgi:hypothetical protein
LNVGISYESFCDPLFETRALPEYSAHHPIRGDVKVKLDMVVVVTLSDGTRVANALQEIKAGVTQALADFEPHFGRKRAHPAPPFRLPDRRTLSLGLPT